MATRWRSGSQRDGDRGHVTDMAGKLQPAEVRAMNAKLAEYRRCSTNDVAVFIAASLEGNKIEDVDESPRPSRRSDSSPIPARRRPDRQ